jgi:sigma-B regulation protein RsbU (phosphoserine phosphatase)
VNILVVEDDRTTQALLQTWLQEWNHRVTTAQNGKEALELINKVDFDLILSNWTLSELDGLGLCRLIRESPDPKYHYIILYTLKTGELDFVAGMDAGADDFISIPLDAGRLRVRIRAAERILTLRGKLAEQNASLNSLNEKLGAAYRTIQSDLQAASALQASLLPTISNVHPSFCLDWLVLPSSFLAGDNLNYFMMQERYLIFYHLDVAGHGIPSALLSVTLNQLLSPQPGSPMVRFDPKLELKRIVPPVDVVSELNRRFQPQGDGYFTMIYGVLDTKTREIRFCQAGHPSPLRISKDETVTTVGDGGFPVGLWPDMTYEETTTRLAPGDRLVLYSDGVMECVNPEGVNYTVEQLQQLLTRKINDPVKEVLQAVQADLEGWSHGRGFPDDISLLIIESR